MVFPTYMGAYTKIAGMWFLNLMLILGIPIRTFVGACL